MKKYTNPPLDGVTCTFFLDRDKETEWKTVYVGNLFERLKEEFSRSEDRTRISRDLDTGQIFQVKATCLFNDEKGYFLGITGDQLEFKQENIYSGWEEIKPVIAQVYSEYKQITNPKKLDTVMLRYFNKIIIPKTDFMIEDYFTVYPNYDALDLSCGNFQFNLVFPTPKGQLDLNILTVPGTNISQTMIILDLLVKIKVMNNEEKSIEEILEYAHDLIQNAFEKSVTDKTRELFK